MDPVGEFGPGRLAPRIRLPGVLQLAQIPAKRPPAAIRQQDPLLSEPRPCPGRPTARGPIADDSRVRFKKKGTGL
jgi:hypothetical protein